MFKLLCLIVFALLVACTCAGVIPLDDGYYGYGGIALAAPKVIAAPIAVKAAATSYQNSNLLALHATPIVTKSVAAPIVTKTIASPLLYDDHYGIGHYGR